MGFSGAKCNAETALQFLADGEPLEVLGMERSGIRMSIRDLVRTIDRLEAEASEAEDWWLRWTGAMVIFVVLGIPVLFYPLGGGGC